MSVVLTQVDQTLQCCFEQCVHLLSTLKDIPTLMVQLTDVQLQTTVTLLYITAVLRMTNHLNNTYLVVVWRILTTDEQVKAGLTNSAAKEMDYSR